MKVIITKKTELENPRLEIVVFLESGQTRIDLKHTCSVCGGYGCHGGKCDDHISLKDDEVLDTIGAENMAVLAQVFGKILGTHKTSGDLKEWLVTPSLSMIHWQENLEGMANKLKGDLVVINYIGGSTALVQATQAAVDTIKQAGYSVNPNGAKFAISK